MKGSILLHTLHSFVQHWVVVVALICLLVTLPVATPTWIVTASALPRQTVPPFDFTLALPQLANKPLPVNLTMHAAADHSPAWSPDGRKIAFVSTRSNDSHRSELFVMNADGSEVTQLTDKVLPPLSPPDWGWDAFSPVWSPDGKQIAFVLAACSPCEGHGTYYASLYIIDTESREVQRSLAPASGPIWSPDGSKMLFADVADYPYFGHRIIVTNAAGGDALLLTERGSYPTWSPDGTQIAFIDEGQQGAGVSIIDVDGNNLKILNTGDKSFGPTWSPDGTQLAYVSIEDYEDYKLRLIGVNGGTPFTLSDVRWASLGMVTWLPDGNHMIFWGREARALRSAFYSIGRDGSDFTRLLDVALVQFLGNPTWSPDRSQIAFEENDEIYVLRLASNTIITDAIHTLE